VSQKQDSALACYNLDKHRTVSIIFGKNIAKKVCSQMILHSPTSPNQCFCTTWWNKAENCVFSLKCWMLFCQQGQNILSLDHSWTTLHLYAPVKT